MSVEESVSSVVTVEDAARYAAQLLWDRQATDPIILDVLDAVAYTDYFVIVSARNEHHMKSLTTYLEKEMRRIGIRAAHQESGRNQRWAILDFEDFMIHIFHKDEREEYDLEGLRHDSPRLEFTPKESPRSIR